MSNVSMQEQDGLAIIQLRGEIDSKTVPAVQAELLPFVEKHNRIIMQMDELKFLSSAGLRMMLLLYRHATSAKGKVALVGVPEAVRDTMQATGFLDFFLLTGTLDEAKASVKA